MVSNSHAYPGCLVPTASAARFVAYAVALVVLAASGAARAATPPPVIAQTEGDWFTEDHRGVVRVAPCGDAICGTIVAQSDFRPDGSAMLDATGRSQCHLAFIRGMRPGDDGRLHGTVTDPRDNTTYNAIMWLGDDGALRLRGYLAVPLLGSTERWERFHGAVADNCHFIRK